MQWLRQSTNTAVIIGPFVDVSDGATPETGLTINQTSVRLHKNGQGGAQRNYTTACSQDEFGMYSCTLNTTDTGTLGHLRLHVSLTATALPVWHDYHIVPTNVWDSLFGSDKLDVNVTSMASDTLTSTAVSTGGGQAVADQVWTRSNADIEALSPVALSPYTMVAKHTNKVDSTAGTLKVYEDDGTTLLVSQTITATSILNPVQTLTGAS